MRQAYELAGQQRGAAWLLGVTEDQFRDRITKTGWYKRNKTTIVVNRQLRKALHRKVTLSNGEAYSLADFMKLWHGREVLHLQENS